MTPTPGLIPYSSPLPLRSELRRWLLDPAKAAPEAPESDLLFLAESAPKPDSKVSRVESCIIWGVTSFLLVPAAVCALGLLAICAVAIVASIAMVF